MPRASSEHRSARPPAHLRQGLCPFSGHAEQRLLTPLFCSTRGGCSSYQSLCTHQVRRHRAGSSRLAERVFPGRAPTQRRLLPADLPITRPLQQQGQGDRRYQGLNPSPCPAAGIFLHLSRKTGGGYKCTALREVPWGRGCEAFEQNLASVSPEWRRSLTPAGLDLQMRKLKAQ